LTKEPDKNPNIIPVQTGWTAKSKTETYLQSRHEELRKTGPYKDFKMILENQNNEFEKYFKRVE
jgi:hypothetical protein